MKRSKRVIVAIAALVGVSLAGAVAYEELKTPHYDLTADQLTHLSMTARLGYDGLEGFEMAVQHPHGITFGDAQSVDRNPVGKLGQPFGSDENLDAIAQKLGYARDDGQEMQSTDTFTPEARADGTYVTTGSILVNMGGDSHEKFVFRNPDTSLFGHSGTVTVAQMEAFFRNPRTELVSLNYYDNDMLWGKCTIDLAFHGNTLITDAASECPHFVTHTSTPELLADLEGIWYAPSVQESD